jgi:hypothetical protein
MDEKGNGNGTPMNSVQEEKPKSILIIEFAEPGSAQFGIRTENATPAQILAAAAWLDWFARKQFDQMAQKGPQLVVPAPRMPARMN